MDCGCLHHLAMVARLPHMSCKTEPTAPVLTKSCLSDAPVHLCKDLSGTRLSLSPAPGAWLLTGGALGATSSAHKGDCTWRGARAVARQRASSATPPAPPNCSAHLYFVHHSIVCSFPALPQVLPQVTPLFNNFAFSEVCGAVPEALEHRMGPQLQVAASALVNTCSILACTDPTSVGLTAAYAPYV